MAQDDWFAFLDADDVWLEDKLKIQMAAMESDPDLDAVFGYVKQFHSPELDEGWKKKTWCPDDPVPGFSPTAMLIRREAFLRVGLFETGRQVGEWQEWYMRAQERRLRMTTLPDVIARRRLHDANNGLRTRNAFDERLQIIKAALDRRRASNARSDE
jgi:glycosyltransferase involved in cell wall biosynthesis